MTITAYVFSKKINSVHTPTTSTTHKDITCTLKAPVSVLTPTLLFQRSTWDLNYNYIGMTLFGKARYYFVNEIRVLSDNLIEVTCAEDCLGTWWDDIKGTSQYIARSSSGYNSFISDPMAIAETSPALDATDTTAIFTPAGGFYVVGLAGIEVLHPITVRGSVSYVAMTQSQLVTLVNSLYINNRATPLSVTNLFTSVLDPIQYIASCVYIPLAFSEYVSSPDSITESISIQPFDNAFSISYSYGTPRANVNGILRKAASVILNSHPQSSTYGFANFPPYSKHYCSFGPFGDFEIDRSECQSSVITFECVIDVCDGTAVCHVKAGSVGGTNVEINTRRGRVGVDVQLTQVRNNPLGVASAVMSAMSAAANPVSGVLSLGQTAISAVQEAVPKATSTGLNGSLAEVVYAGLYIKVHSMFYNIAPVNVFNAGRPVCDYKTLSTLTGAFVMCERARITIPAYKEEISEIEEMLNSGFFTD